MKPPRPLAMAVATLLLPAACGFFTCAEPARGDTTVPESLVKGLELFRHGRYESAKPLLEAGLKSAPGNLEGTLALTELHLRQNDYEAAIPSAERAVELDPRSSPAHLLLAQSFGLKAISISRVRALFFARDIEREYRTAVVLDGKNIEARLGLVQFYLVAPSIAGGGYDKARVEAEAIVPIDPVRGLALLARVEGEKGHDAEALVAIDRLEKIDAVQALLAHARYYHRKKDPSRAVPALLEVAQQPAPKPRDLTAAAILLLDMERSDEALRLLEKAAAIDPDDAGAVYQTGKVCLLSKKDLPRAEAAFKRYLALERQPETPSGAAAHWRLGQVYQAMGRKVEARRELEEAARQEPRNEEFKKTLAALG